MRRLVAFIVIASAIIIVWEIRRGRLQSGQPSDTPTATGSEITEGGGRQLGPFVTGGNEYRVVLQEKPRLPGSTQETGNTVVKMEIQNSAGTVEYQRTFPVQTELEGFSDAWFVTAMVLPGRSGTGLMINYALDSEPSGPTPENESWWQLFGVVDGKLRAFSGPISIQGDLLPSDSLSD